MRTIKYLWRLLKDLLNFAWHNKAWWIVPIVIVLMILAVVVAATTGALPFIYTL